MARTMVIGLTESGTRTKVNEDSFSCGDRVYPEMISGSEEQSLSSSDYTQLYVVTQGFGGSGAGDLAGRIIHRVSIPFVAKLDEYKHPKLDFVQFARDLIREMHYLVLSQITLRNGQRAGASFALLLIDANTAYVLNVGNTKVHLFRDDELHSLVDPENTSNGLAHSSYIGDRSLSFDDPKPNCVKRFDLMTGDVILLTSDGFHKNFHQKDLAANIAAPDAFAANIRLSQIYSRQANNTENGTILAIKVRDLELAEPDDTAAIKNMERFQKYYGPTSSEPDVTMQAKPVPYNGVNKPPISTAQGVMTPPRQAYRKQRETAPGETRSKGNAAMNRQAKKAKRRSNWKTFGLSLLIGFLIGMAAILIAWFIILR
ncbi:MAG TPA: hypothetical protein GX734_01015 [Clostridiaceae bacterium]|nr:hypothetical protein [Clostridiaceae bacterium]